jgi:adenosylmethionine-8-amino-7-oxononanoate aminotransferase
MARVAVFGSRVAYPDPYATYRRIVRGQGPYLFDESGVRLFDASCGSGSVILGHADPDIVGVLAEQAARLTVFPGAGLGSAVVERYAAALVNAAYPNGGGRAITFSSGSDAVEAAIKLAIQYHRLRGVPSKTTILGRAGSYHGNSLGGLAAGSFLARRAPFEPVLPRRERASAADCLRCDFDRVPDSCAVDCAASVERAILEEGPESVAAFVAEPIVGATLSAVVPDPRYFQAVREICDRYDVLLIADEVMTGFGRTGRLFCLHHWQIDADIIIAGKAMSGGYIPLSAVIAASRVAEPFEQRGEPFQNGQTYCCSPLACAVGQHVLDRLEGDGLLTNAAARGAELLSLLIQHMPGDHLRNFRGRGLMIGFDIAAVPLLEAKALARTVRDLAIANGLLVYVSSGSAHSTDRAHAMLLPPLNVSSDDVRSLADMLRQTETDLAFWIRKRS